VGKAARLLGFWVENLGLGGSQASPEKEVSSNFYVNNSGLEGVRQEGGFRKNRGEEPQNAPTQLQTQKQKPACPECGSTRLYKDGLRYLADGRTIQRWLCRNCGYRFSENHLNCSNKFQQVQKIHTLILNSPKALTVNCQGSSEAFPGKASTSLGKLVKTLAEVESRNDKRAAGATETTDLKGKLVEYLWHLKKQGYKESTIKTHTNYLKWLIRIGANLLDAENVKEAIATLQVEEATKRTMANVYNSFSKYYGIEWVPPRYYGKQSLPFIPLEREIDDLIACSGKKLSTLLQLLKETGMRIGEALELKWTDIDFERKVVKVEPEKRSNPRVLKISDKLINMFNLLPKRDVKIFGGRQKMRNFQTLLFTARTKAAVRLQNPRLKLITFHTIRHWKGTMEYHKTKDIIHVKNILGHKSINNTMIYINLEQALFNETQEEFHVKVAYNLEEACKLLEAGFEYVTDIGGVKVFRKRK
jgi:integrase/recombinase XerD